MIYADLGKRIIALIIDDFVISLICGLIFVPLVFINFVIAIAISPFVPFLYFVLMEGGGWHATFGKKAVGIFVADFKGVGISYSTAILRTLCKVLSGAFFCIGYLMGFFSEQKQCLHDMLAQTYVFEGSPSYYDDYYDSAPKLVCIKGPAAGRTYAIGEGGILIGRDSLNCQVVLKAKNVSRNHCLITYNSASDMFVVSDRNSSYGTFLANGSKIKPSEPVALRSGERFYVAAQDNLFEVR